MKVVQINATYGFGSTGTIVKDIDHLLQRKGIESYVVCPITSEMKENIIEIGNKCDRKYHALMTRLSGLQGYYSKRATAKLISRLREIEPDIVHLHNLHSNYINVNALFAYLRQCGIGTVITLHDCWFFTGKCFHYAQEGCMKWKTGCGNCPKRKKDIPSLIFDSSRRVYTDKQKAYAAMNRLYVVPVSKWMERQVEDSILKKCNIRQIYNGVDLEVFFDRGDGWKKDNLLEGRFVILGMANKWLDPKNYPILCKVAAQLGDSIRLVLVGKGHGAEEVDNKWMKYVDFVKEPGQLAEIYSAADVFVNLTWEDSLPTVNIEAIACGTPVVTFDSGGSPEIIDEQTGIVVPQGDVQALLDAIFLIRKSGKQLYRAACRRRAERLFDKNKQYDEYLELYQTICGSRRTGEIAE